ncbi:MAG: hypothetical protein AB7W16_07945 [Candidatus Obscuribacterales bacterium]
MKRSLRSVLALPAVFALLLFTGIFASPALAQSAQTWLPVKEFDTNQAVYLDPGLKNHRSYPVSLNGLEDRLKAQGQTHGLKFYFVMTEQGSETNPTSSKFAVWKLDEFAAMVAGKLPADDYVLILLVRSSSDPNKFSFAANGGNRLQQYGLTGSYFSQSGSPLNANRSVYLPNDPGGFGNAVAAGVNQAVSQHFADLKRQEEQRKLDEERRKQEELKRIEQEKQRAIDAENRRIAHEAFMKALPGYLLWYGTPSVIFLALLIMFFLYRRLRSQVEKLVASWREKITTSSDMYLRLEKGYFGFLQHQAEWQEKFKGNTAVKFKKAVTDFANYSARQIAANRRFQEAEKLFESSRYPFALFGKLARVRTLLTTQVIVITGEELPLELASLYGGLVTRQEYTPDAVLTEMEKLFDVTNRALAEIKKAFDGAAQNKLDIEALDTAIAGIKKNLEAAGLTFDPYADRYTGLLQGKKAFLAILDSNPLDAFKGSEEVEQGFESLKADLNRAIAIQQSFTATETAIGKAKARVTEVRSTPADYRYPVEKDSTPRARITFFLAEEGGNPDTLTGEADEHLARARKACLNARLDQAESERSEAEKAAQAAIDMVASILDAKLFVEKQVVPVTTNLTKLRGELPAATTAVTQLKAEFLAKNFPGEPEKLDGANKVADSTDAELAKVKKAYEDQRYLAARKLLTAVGGNIQQSIDKLVEIHSRLAKLRELKDHARKIVTAAEGLASTLVDKLDSNSFTTSAATDRAYAQQKPVLKAQRQDVDRDITDWVAAAAAADALLAALQSVDRAIDEEKAQYNNAVNAIAALTTAIGTAERSVRDSDTRQPARDKLAEANQALSKLERDIKVEKSDWANIARRATDARSTASEAKNLAEADKKAADAARSAISSARSNINGTQTSYGHGVFADLSSANSYLGQAERALSSGDYEGASRLAKRASSAADEAESSARARVAAIIAELERQRRERERQERERREREERERREREERNRRNDDFGGSGRSGGGSWGGGRSGGGGDF